MRTHLPDCVADCCTDGGSDLSAHDPDGGSNLNAHGSDLSAHAPDCCTDGGADMAAADTPNSGTGR